MRVFVAALVSAGLVFLWSGVSWLFLNWRAAELQTFTNEAAVSRVLAANAPVPGLYLLPNSPGGGSDWKAAGDRMRAGPFVFAQVRTGRAPEWSFAWLFATSFATQLLGCLLLIYLLRGARVETYGGRVLYCTIIGLLAGILGEVPNSTWWEFPWNWTLVAIADRTVSWFLAGLVIAAVTRPPPR